MKNKHQAIDLNSAFESDADMTNRESKIITNISDATGFVPEKNIWRSKYWGKNLGASHWLGQYHGENAVLKIQGVKPEVSETHMINEFQKQNRSKIIKPPTILSVLEWNDSGGYEAIIEEYSSGPKVLQDGKVSTKEEIELFVNSYMEYRENCLPNNPWLSKPNLTNNMWDIALEKLLSSSMNAFPNHPFRVDEDYKLAKKAYLVLQSIYENVDLEFLHGHFSCKDLIYKNGTKKEIVLFSNLFWKWRYPFFDAVFGYHWFMYELANVVNIMPSQVEIQSSLWIDEIFKVTGANKSLKIRRFVNAALLERAVAGFIIDSFLCNPKKKISRYLYESTKTEAKRLISELE